MADVTMKEKNKTTDGGPSQPVAPVQPTSDSDVLKDLGYDVTGLTLKQIDNRSKMIENNVRLMKSEHQRIQSEIKRTADRVKENKEKIKLNKSLPYLVANVVEVECYVCFVEFCTRVLAHQGLCL